MNKILFSVGCAMFLLMAVTSYAQDATDSQDTTRSTATRDTEIATYLQNGAIIHVRQEEAFDGNYNHKLEPDEIKAFFKEVYTETARWPVKNTSDILYWVDTNADGYIDRSEASVLSRY